MKKFIVLLKKEIRELITPQLIVPLVITMVLFFGIGKVVGNEIQKTQIPQNFLYIDQDNTEISQQVTNALKAAGLTLVKPKVDVAESWVAQAKEENLPGVIIIKSGFQNAVLAQTPAPVEIYSVIRDFSVLGNQKIAAVSQVIGVISETAKSEVLTRHSRDLNQEFLARPLGAEENVVVGDSQAQISPGVVLAFISTQSTFIPIVLFIVILLAAQLIATNMASEKENKTLETLLAAPVGRGMLVAAKLFGAGIVAGLMAVIYMFGFRSYIGGLTGNATNALNTPEIMAALHQLGLQFSSSDYLLLGLSLFMAMLVALSIAMLLGVLVEDVKSVPGVISPLMVLIAIPYILVLFLDINSLSPVVKYLTYAIPFSHPFLASPDILLDKYSAVWYGVLYQLVFFLVFVWIVARVFSSDKILTLKLNFLKKK